MTPDGPGLLRALLTLAALGTAVAIGVGYLGSLAPLFDTVSHFRGHLVAALFVLALALVAARAFAAAGLSATVAAIALYALMPYLPPFRPAEPGGTTPTARYTLLQMNLRWNAADKAEAIRTIGRLAPDIVTLEEASEDWKPILQVLDARYPYRFACENRWDFTDALILSRRPFVEGSQGVCSRDKRFAARAIDFNGQRLVVAAQHLRWPWPGSQWRQLEATESVLQALPKTGLPVLIAGDFNAAPWSAALARYARLSGTSIVGGIGPTWFFRPVTGLVAPFAGLPIDNVLASNGVEILDVKRQAATASDHLPVLVTFSLPPAPGDPAEPLSAVAGMIGQGDSATIR